MMIFKKLQAFTLAEVLITLGIIGVVAAMTIPTLMKNTQDAELKTAFKKTFAIFNQVAMSMANDNGGTLSGVFSTATSDDIISKIVPYVKSVKTCATGDLANCWNPSGTWQYYDGSTPSNNVPAFYANNGGIILNDGTLVFVSRISSGTCNSNAWLDYHLTGCGGAQNASDATYDSKICNGFLVDVNGRKGPNTVGRDIFSIFFTSDGKAVVPPAADCTANYGHGRAAQILSGQL